MGQETISGKVARWNAGAAKGRPIGSILYSRNLPIAGIFAINWNSMQVFYHDRGQWFLYNTDSNVRTLSAHSGFAHHYCHIFKRANISLQDLSCAFHVSLRGLQDLNGASVWWSSVSSPMVPVCRKENISECIVGIPFQDCEDIGCDRRKTEDEVCGTSTMP